MPDREASVFHRYSAYLARRAGGIVLRWTICCGVLGALLGAVTLSSWAHWPVSHRQAYLVALLGAVCGAFLGRAIGSGRAQLVLFQAQLAQHQLEFERRLLEFGAAAQLQAPVVEAPPAPPVTQPQPEPVYLPEPPLAFEHGFALPELPTLSDPGPAPVPEPVAVEPAHAPAEVVPFVPRPEPHVAPLTAPVPATLASAPPLSGETPAPAAPPAGDPDGYGWWRPGVNE